ncbi:UNVERIFIED_CONTAM: RpS4 [Trichonephila clavipes]
MGPKGIPFLITHDARTIRYPDPLIKGNDSIQLDIATGKIMGFVKFETGNIVMVTGGRNLGRVGTITSRERHPGSFDIVHIKDSLGHSFATRLLGGNLIIETKQMFPCGCYLLKQLSRMLVGAPVICKLSIKCSFSQFLWTAHISILVSGVNRVKLHSDNHHSPSTS